MTLDEAITHCVEKAAKLRKEADDCKEIYKEQCEKPNYKSYISNCLECSREHEQLAEWLKELKTLKERSQGDLISCEALKEAIETYDKFACLPDTTLVPFRILNEPEKNYEPYVRLRDIRNAIDNAPTVNPQKIVTIPHELIEKLVLVDKSCRKFILAL